MSDEQYESKIRKAMHDKAKSSNNEVCKELCKLMPLKEI